MKTVGVFSRCERLNDKLIYYVPGDIVHKINDRVNINIINICRNDTYNRILKEVKKCDGIIFPGGDDLIPLEIKVIKYLYKKDIPTLGICLGMQEMACAFKGEMGTLTNFNHKVKNDKAHKVIINKRSKLYRFIKQNNIVVNSRHKDYIISTKLNISAYSDDNIIEAVEAKDKKFFIGVQWHPENLSDKCSKELFNCFVKHL